MGIRYLFMDVDGTLTDGKLYMGSDGELMKCFDVKDGCGIKELLPELKIMPVIISGRKSEIVKVRCDELGIKIIRENVSDKKSEMKRVIRELVGDVELEDILASVAYIGDDLADVACIEMVNRCGGLTACPSDAAYEVKKKVRYVTNSNGGSGAVREFIEYIRQESNVYDSLK